METSVWIQSITSYLRLCPICHRWSSSRPIQWLCPDCQLHVYDAIGPWRLASRPQISKGLAILRWDDVTPWVGKLIYSLKGGGPELANRWVVSQFAELASQFNPSAVVAAPSSRLLACDHAYIWAKALAERQHWQFVGPIFALGRPHHRLMQKQLERCQRWERQIEFSDQFALVANQLPASPWIWVDDVLTTGATFSQCQKLMRPLGIELIPLVVAERPFVAAKQIAL